jgi:hypothetical protein
MGDERCIQQINSRLSVERESLWWHNHVWVLLHLDIFCRYTHSLCFFYHGKLHPSEVSQLFLVSYNFKGKSHLYSDSRSGDGTVITSARLRRCKYKLFERLGVRMNDTYLTAGFFHNGQNLRLRPQDSRTSPSDVCLSGCCCCCNCRLLLLQLLLLLLTLDTGNLAAENHGRSSSAST